MHELLVSSQDLMDGRAAEGETVVGIQFAKLVPFGTYQTALGPQTKKFSTNTADFDSLC